MRPLSLKQFFLYASCGLALVLGAEVYSNPHRSAPDKAQRLASEQAAKAVQNAIDNAKLERIHASAATFFASRGEVIVGEKGCLTVTTKDPGLSNSDACVYSVEKQQDDGLTRVIQYNPVNDRTALQSCEVKDNAAGFRLIRDARAAFITGAGKAFAGVGFSMRGLLAAPESDVYAESGECVQSSQATFLVAADGKLYTADYSQNRAADTGEVSGQRVANVSSVGPRVTK
jgi:hypothetical protein